MSPQDLCSPLSWVFLDTSLTAKHLGERFYAGLASAGEAVNAAGGESELTTRSVREVVTEGES